MSEELKIKEIEVQKLNLQPEDVLMVSILHEDANEEAFLSLRDMLTKLFPNNKVMLFSMASEGYVKFTVASQSKLSYCSNCDCGKKEQAEQEKK